MYSHLEEGRAGSGVAFVLLPPRGSAFISRRAFSFIHKAM